MSWLSGSKSDCRPSAVPSGCPCQAAYCYSAVPNIMLLPITVLSAVYFVCLQIGHALGLLHDGITAGPAYFQGQGDW
jgi:hypothetical protein